MRRTRYSFIYLHQSSSSVLQDPKSNLASDETYNTIQLLKFSSPQAVRRSASAGCLSPFEGSGAHGSCQPTCYLFCKRHTATRLAAGSSIPLAVLPVYELLFLVTVPHQQLLRFFASCTFRASGDEGIRTPGLCRARAALSQLSYIPR